MKYISSANYLVPVSCIVIFIGEKVTITPEKTYWSCLAKTKAITLKSRLFFKLHTMTIRMQLCSTNTNLAIFDTPNHMKLRCSKSQHHEIGMFTLGWSEKGIFLFLVWWKLSQLKKSIGSNWNFSTWDQLGFRTPIGRGSNWFQGCQKSIGFNWNQLDFFPGPLGNILPTFY